MAERDKKGQFVKGHAPMGIALGQPPEVKKARLQLKSMVSNLLVDEFDNFKDTFQALSKKNPNAYCRIYVDMMAYSPPKISTIAFGADDETQNNPATQLLKEIAEYNKK